MQAPLIVIPYPSNDGCLCYGKYGAIGLHTNGGIDTPQFRAGVTRSFVFLHTKNVTQWL